MEIRERKIEHTESPKKVILDAAKKLFINNGYQATSIRKIANEIEYSPATLYVYFKGKAEIAYALHQEGFRILRTQFRILDNIENPFERIKAMGRVYIRFSLEYSDWYELMFVRREPMEYIEECLDKEWGEGKQAFETFMYNVQDCQETGYFKDLETSSVAMMIWSMLHGLCMLQINGQLNSIKDNKNSSLVGEDILESTYSTFVKTLGKLK